MQNDLCLQQVVKYELARLDGFDPSTVGVEIHHGVVKLAGRIKDPALRNTLQSTVQRIEGVRSVVLDFDLKLC